MGKASWFFVFFALSVLTNNLLAADKHQDNYFGFNVTTENGNAVISWTTDNGDASRFVIEHSVDGTVFVPICDVAAEKGNLNYTFTHSSPDRNAVNYYRLKQVNVNGNDMYSLIRVVRFTNETGDVQVATNPVKDVLEITTKDEVRIQVTSVYGKNILKMKLHPGTHRLNTSGWDTGSYQLSIYKKRKLVDKKEVLKF